MTRIHRIIGIAALFLGACQQVAPLAGSRLDETDSIQVQTTAPADNRTGKCWENAIAPAGNKTTAEQMRPAGSAIAASPGGAPTDQTAQPRHEIWFEIPCDHDINSDFVTTLQRALKSRGLYRGEPTGVMDTKTLNSVRQYQKGHGLDSSVLSLAAARHLGLVTYVRPPSR